MDIFIQIVHDIIVAWQAAIHAKEVLKVFIDIRGVRMEILLGNVLVTVLAGGLAMDRGMKFFGIYQPGGIACLNI